MPLKAFAIIAAALAGAAAMIGAALLYMSDDPDPHAYPGSKPGFSLEDAQKQSSVPLPECARDTAKFYLGSAFADSTIVMDFTAPDECVASFLTGVGIDASTPVVLWRPVFEESSPPIHPPARSGITWDFPPTDRVECWTVRRTDGVNDHSVRVVVNRSAQPQHVYIRAIVAN
ncbi:hypothetical protein AB0A74_32165 [Saccharothrix sp. NPDC042600]|uniref:hypothetical protein n=1 Tax=Saccharothrix TaxID=2071 RepID=UPI00340AB2F8|nr:hypothetical protein GCM10017745_43490 [Saccharothrix mutabilis subsp. capreolus]